MTHLSEHSHGVLSPIISLPSPIISLPSSLIQPIQPSTHITINPSNISPNISPNISVKSVSSRSNRNLMFILNFHRPFIIIGMHRSGTSLVARLLHESGIHMGAERDHNEESMPFLSENQQMFAKENFSWLEPGEVDIIPDHSALSMYVNHFRIDPNDYSWGGKPRKLLMYYGHNVKWGFKDPRSSFTLKSWLHLFPKAKVIHVVRHPGSVADSLMRRNKKEGEVFDERLNDAGFCVELWAKYVSMCKAQMEDLPANRTLSIRYEDLLRGGRTLTDLGRFVGTDLVTSFSETVHPDRSSQIPSINTSDVSELMRQFGYED